MSIGLNELCSCTLYCLRSREHHFVSIYTTNCPNAIMNRKRKKRGKKPNKQYKNKKQTNHTHKKQTNKQQQTSTTTTLESNLHPVLHLIP